MMPTCGASCMRAGCTPAGPSASGKPRPGPNATSIAGTDAAVSSGSAWRRNGGPVWAAGVSGRGFPCSTRPGHFPADPLFP